MYSNHNKGRSSFGALAFFTGLLILSSLVVSTVSIDPMQSLYGNWPTWRYMLFSLAQRITDPPTLLPIESQGQPASCASVAVASSAIVSDDDGVDGIVRTSTPLTVTEPNYFMPTNLMAPAAC